MKPEDSDNQAKLLTQLRDAKSQGDSNRVFATARQLAILKIQQYEDLCSQERFTDAMRYLLDAARFYKDAGDTESACKAYRQVVKLSIDKELTDIAKCEFSRLCVLLNKHEVDNNSFEDLVGLYTRDLVEYCIFSLGIEDINDVNDIKQQTLFKAWQKIGTLKKIDGFRNWLFVIAKNENKNNHRRNKRYKEAVKSYSESKRKDHNSVQSKFKDLLEKVPDALNRRILYEYYKCGYTDAEIANNIHINDHYCPINL